jgi:hypothetical protein
VSNDWLISLIYLSTLAPFVACVAVYAPTPWRSHAIGRALMRLLASITAVLLLAIFVRLLDLPTWATWVLRLSTLGAVQVAGWLLFRQFLPPPPHPPRFEPAGTPPGPSPKHPTHHRQESNDEVVRLHRACPHPGRGRALLQLCAALGVVLPFDLPGIAVTAPADDGFYTVQPGDTLSGIVRTVTVENIKAWNGLTSDVIQPGQRLRLTAPATVEPPPPPPPPPPRRLPSGYLEDRPGPLRGPRRRLLAAAWDAIEAKFGKFQGHMRVYWGTGTNGQLSPN